MEIKETVENNRKTIFLDEDFHRVITFKVDREINRRIEELCTRSSMTKTGLVLSMISNFLSENEVRRQEILHYPDVLNVPSVIGIRISYSLLSAFIDALPPKYSYTVALRKITSFYSLRV